MNLEALRALERSEAHERWLDRLSSAPEQDPHWQVYADWLQGQGHPRGELIALELSGSLDATRQQRCLTFLRPLLVPDYTTQIRFDWWRGFPTLARIQGAARKTLGSLEVALKAPAARFLQTVHVEALFESHRFAVEKRFDALLSLLEFAGIERLDLGGNSLDAKGARLIAECAPLASVRWLGLSRCGLQDRSIAQILDAQALKSVSYLNLHANYISDEGAKLLARTQGLQALESLDLSRNMISTDGVLELLRSERLPALKRLEVEGNRLTVPAVRALAQAEHLKPFKRLKMRAMVREDEQLEALIAIGMSVETLDLSNNEINEHRMPLLSSASWMKGVRSLDLSENRIGAKGALLLRGARLHTLDLGANALKDAGVRALMEALKEGASEPMNLRLYENEIGDEGAIAISESGLALDALNLAGNRISDVGARALARAYAGRLSQLDLSCNRVGPSGLTELSSSLGGRTKLTVFGNRAP